MKPDGSATADDRPAADLVTGRSLLLYQERPVVAYTQWISDAMGFCLERGIDFQLVTPPNSRVTFPLRNALAYPLFTWVVNDQIHGLYDGLRSHALRWEPGTGYVPDVEEGSPLIPAKGFLAPSPEKSGHPHLELELTLPEGDKNTGCTEEIIMTTLTGDKPECWGITEPLALSWELHKKNRESVKEKGIPLLFRSTASSPVQTTGVIQRKMRADSSFEKVSIIMGDTAINYPMNHVNLKIEHLRRDLNILDLRLQEGIGRGDLTFEPRNNGH